MTWTPDRVALLTKFWNQEPQLSAREIAERLGGVTRNAVIGKAGRVGLPGRGSPIVRGMPVAEVKARRRERDRNRPTKPRAEAPPRVIRPRPAVARFKACQFIEGEPSADDACKCLAPTVPGRSYCIGHSRRCFQEMRR